LFFNSLAAVQGFFPGFAAGPASEGSEWASEWESIWPLVAIGFTFAAAKRCI
jgi:hypothetical protein